MFDPNNLPVGHPQRREPILKAPPATLALAGVLILIHLLLAVLPEADGDWILLTFGFQPLAFLAAFEGQGDLGATAWPLVTHLFLHLDVLHLVTNCGFLLAFASPVERRFGWLAFLAIFLICGIVGALFQVWLVLGPEGPAPLLIGASGGIFGLMGTTLMLGPMVLGRRLALGRIILVLMGINLAIGLLSEVGLVGDYRIGWQAHAGGFLTGLLIGRLARRAN